MKTYKVTLTIIADSHPRKWVCETVAEVLNPGEDILDYDIVTLEDILEEEVDI